MLAYLDEDFFRAVEKDLKEYSRDYSKLIERSKILDIQERDRMPDYEKSFEILNNFGATV